MNKPRYLLALDTSFAACSVALLADGKIWTEFEATARKHNELILPMVKSVLQQANVGLSEINAIAFGRGPGSFTGVRIAAGVTQALAYAHSLPVLAVSSLQGLAQGFYRTMQAEKVLLAIDARAQSLYFGAYGLKAGLMQSIIRDQQLSPEQMQLPEGSWLAVGDAWQAYALPKPEEIVTDWQLHAEDLLPFAETAYLQNQSVPADQALPVYFTTSYWQKLPGRN
jgi:tRNA threonylcarbamoyladenosine biosynthesis protein TsaB